MTKSALTTLIRIRTLTRISSSNGSWAALYTGWCKGVRDLTHGKVSGVSDPINHAANEVGLRVKGRPCTEDSQKFGAK